MDIIDANLLILPEGKPIQMEERRVVAICAIATGQPLHILTDGTRSALSLAISPNNETLVMGDNEGMIRLWNMHSGKMIKLINVCDPKKPTSCH